MTPRLQSTEPPVEIKDISSVCVNLVTCDSLLLAVIVFFD